MCIPTVIPSNVPKPLLCNFNTVTLRSRDLAFIITVTCRSYLFSKLILTLNNPKYANRIIKQLKAYPKAHNFDESYAPYKAAYGSMPSHASDNPESKNPLYVQHPSLPLPILPLLRQKKSPIYLSLVPVHRHIHNQYNLSNHIFPNIQT